MNSKQQQELEQNLVFLRDQFRDLDAQIKLPHSLDAEMLRYKLEHLDLLEEKPRKKYPWLRPAAGVAACFVLIFGSIYAMRGNAPELSAAPAQEAPMSSAAAAPEAAPVSEEGDAKVETAMDASDGEPVYASNYTEVRDAAAKMSADDLASGAEAPRMGGAAFEEAVVPETAGAETADAGLPETEAAPVADAPLAATPKAAAFNAPAAGNFSAANPEEYGTDAQDTFKSRDGYLYSFVRNDASSNGAIYVASAESTTFTAKIDLPDLDLREFYLHDDRLITVGARYGTLESAPKETIVGATDSSLVNSASESSDRMQETSLTTVTVYDISDPANPKSIQTFTQDGGYLASRMSEDGELSMVSSKYVDAAALTDQGALLTELVPVVSNGTKTELLEPDQLAISQLKTTSAAFSVATVLDTSSGAVSTQAVLGGSTDGAYLTDSSIYLYGSGYESASQMEFTRIWRFASADTLRFAGETELAGRAGGRSSFSEADGNLRVVLTAASDLMNIDCTSSVSVLGADLSPVASLQGIVPNVALSSVRFLDDVVYLGLMQDDGGVIAVDLRDPSSPKLAGEQSLSTLPDYLRSVGGGLLVGIGGTGDGMKLSLLDASDPLKLQELHSVSFRGGSEALYNDRSVLVDTAKKLVAFQTDGTEVGSGYRVYSFDKEVGFVLEVNLTPQGEGLFSRGLTAGGKLYLSSERQIESFLLDDFSRLKTLSL